MDDLQLKVIGARLVTSDGFGCTSCHAVNDISHGASPVNARGPNLGGLGARIRPEWFQRWVANPLRIVPRVEMPSITTHVPGVLDNDLPKQLDVLWDALNKDGFRPPLPNAVRVVRRSGKNDSEEPAALLTEVTEWESQRWIKPMVIGLRNRHNLLFDLEHFRLDGWWIGDTARQRATGKRWYWEVSGENLLGNRSTGAEIALVSKSDGGKAWEPLTIGQFNSEMDRWQHRRGSLEVSHRLRYLLEPAKEGIEGANLLSPPAGAATVSIVQRWESLLDAQGRSGWRRTVRATQVPLGMNIRVQVVGQARAEEGIISKDRREIAWRKPGDTKIRIASPAGAYFMPDGAMVVEPTSSSNEGGIAEWVFEMTTGLPVDQFPMPPRAEAKANAPIPLESVPDLMRIS